MKRKGEGGRLRGENIGGPMAADLAGAFLGAVDTEEEAARRPVKTDRRRAEGGSWQLPTDPTRETQQRDW